MTINTETERVWGDGVCVCAAGKPLGLWTVPKHGASALSTRFCDTHTLPTFHVIQQPGFKDGKVAKCLTSTRYCQLPMGGGEGKYLRPIWVVHH